MKKGEKAPPKPPEFDAERVRDISYMVYAERLGQKDFREMTEKKGEAGVRKLSASYDALTRVYMRALGVS